MEWLDGPASLGYLQGGVSQIVWTQSPRLEQTKENKWHVYPRSKLLNKSAPSTQPGAPQFSTRGTSQRILTHIAGFFLFKRHFSTNNLIDDHGVRKNVHLRQGRIFQHISQKDLSPPSVVFGANLTVTLVISILPKWSEFCQPIRISPPQTHLLIICGPFPHLRGHPMLGASQSKPAIQSCTNWWLFRLKYVKSSHWMFGDVWCSRHHIGICSWQLKTTEVEMTFSADPVDPSPTTKPSPSHRLLVQSSVPTRLLVALA